MFVGGKSNIRRVHAPALTMFLLAVVMPAEPVAGRMSIPPKERQVALRAAIENLMTTFGDRSEPLVALKAIKGASPIIIDAQLII